MNSLRMQPTGLQPTATCGIVAGVAYTRQPRNRKDKHMLTLTEEAQTIVKTITSQSPDVGDGEGGLRMNQRTRSSKAQERACSSKRMPPSRWPTKCSTRRSTSRAPFVSDSPSGPEPNGNLPQVEGSRGTKDHPASPR